MPEKNENRLGGNWVGIPGFAERSEMDTGNNTFSTDFVGKWVQAGL